MSESPAIFGSEQSVIGSNQTDSNSGFASMKPEEREKRETALEYLKEIVDECNSEGKGNLDRFYYNNQFDFFHILDKKTVESDLEKTSVKANDELFRNLKDLRGYSKEMSEEDNALFEGILQGKIANRQATVKDIRKLGKLMDRVTYCNGDTEKKAQYALSSLKTLSDRFRNERANRTMSWSDSKGDVAAKHRTWTTSTGRKEAGQWYAAMLKPIRQHLLEQKVDEYYLKEFDAQIELLKEGDMKTHQLVELQQLVEEAMNPMQVARDKINHLANLARFAGPNKTVTWRDEQSDFEVTNKRWTTSDGRIDAGKKLKRLIDTCLPKLMDESNSDIPDDDRDQLKWSLTHGTLKSDQILYIQGLLERAEDPKLAALHELDRLSEQALDQSDDCRITWRTERLGVKFTKHFYMNEGLEEAGERIAWRLEGLKSLHFDPDRISQEVSGILERIESGEGTVNDIKWLKARCDNNLGADDELLNDQRKLQSASSTLDDIASSKKPASGKQIYRQLAKIRSLVSDYDYQSFGTFETLSMRIGTNRATSRDIQELKELVDKVKAKQLENTGYRPLDE